MLVIQVLLVYVVIKPMLDSSSPDYASTRDDKGIHTTVQDQPHYISKVLANCSVTEV